MHRQLKMSFHIVPWTGANSQEPVSALPYDVPPMLSFKLTIPLQPTIVMRMSSVLNLIGVY